MDTPAKNLMIMLLLHCLPAEHNLSHITAANTDNSAEAELRTLYLLLLNIIMVSLILANGANYVLAVPLGHTCGCYPMITNMLNGEFPTPLMICR